MKQCRLRLCLAFLSTDFVSYESHELPESEFHKSATVLIAWLGSTVTAITEPSKALESLNGPDKCFQQSDKTYAFWSSAGKARDPKS